MLTPGRKSSGTEGSPAAISAIRSIVIALTLLFASALPALAQAECEGNEYPLTEYDSDVMREYLLSTVDEVESYFRVKFPAVCMDDGENGAYVDLDRDGMLVIGSAFIWKMADISLNHVAAVLAHETAHRFQSDNDFLDNLQAAGNEGTKCIELHADFMAGGFMRHRSTYMTVRPEDIATEFYELGDGDVFAKDHHGLGPERQLSFAAGYNGVADEAAKHDDAQYAETEVTYNATMGFIYVSRAKCDPTS